jgi:beta-lactamase superfamily II metal-dependent hydrolase
MFRRCAALAATLALMLIAVVLADAKQPGLASSKDLKIAVVDVEGGAATLFLTPEGRSLLIDTGWPPGFVFPKPKPGEPPPPVPTSSADRIAAAAAEMGIKKIDYLEMTHYHGDHLGGLQSLLEKLPVDTFIDHGPSRQPPPPNANAPQSPMSTDTLYGKWLAASQGHRHITIQAGQTIEIGSLSLKFVASDGNILSAPLHGAGEPNPLCKNVAPKAPAPVEDVASLGVLMTFGKTSILDFGDLTWDKELELLCPVNKVGRVDVYFVPGHGNDLSNISPIAAFDPLVALLQNGPRKGGDPDAIRIVNSIPELEGFWQLHADALHPDLDSGPNYIANLNGEPDHAYSIELDITKDGRITVTNPRNGFTKAYQARGMQARY